MTKFKLSFESEDIASVTIGVYDTLQEANMVFLGGTKPILDVVMASNVVSISDILERECYLLIERLDEDNNEIETLLCEEMELYKIKEYLRNNARLIPFIIHIDIEHDYAWDVLEKYKGRIYESLEQVKNIVESVDGMIELYTLPGFINGLNGDMLSDMPLYANVYVVGE